MKYLFIISIVILILFFYSACIISSRCTKEEDLMDKEMYKNKEK